MAKERVRVGIIGAGWAGRAHARFYKRVPFVDVVGWADVVPGKAAEAALEAGVPPSGVFEDYNQMLEKLDLDAVSVATFNMGTASRPSTHWPPASTSCSRSRWRPTSRMPGRSCRPGRSGATGS